MIEATPDEFETEVLSTPPRAFDRSDLTPDGKYLFCFLPMPGGRTTRTWINGRYGRPFDALVPFADDGKPYRLSPKRSRFVYVMRRGDEAFVGVDDAEFGPYTNISRQIQPFFSPDDRQIVYAVLAGDDVRLVIDGVEVPGIRPAAERPLYSADGGRLAFVATGADRRAGEWVVLDGESLPVADGILKGSMAFSPNGRRFAYGRHSGAAMSYVLDGRPGPSFKNLGVGVFSPDGSRFIYVASDGRHSFLVEDDVPGPAFASVLAALFSPDGDRVAYLAADAKDKVRVVVDDVPGPVWHDAGSPAFSADGRHVAYVAYESSGGFLRRQVAARVVVDGVAGLAYAAVRGSPVFGPDGRVAFAAKSGGRWFVVVEGVEGPSFEWVFPPTWSVAGRVAYVAGPGDGVNVTVDGVVGPSVDTVIELDQQAITFSPDGQHVVYGAVIAGAHRLVVDGRFGPPMVGFDYPVFADDHVTVAGMKDGKFVRLRMSFA